MKEDKYFVIFNSDGDTYIGEVSKEELESRLNEQYYENAIFLEKLNESDTNYWGGNAVLIIKGKIIVPKEEKVVVKKTIE